jgi:hypothetical protein
VTQVNWKYLWAIMTAVAAWGCLHAYGAYLFNHNPLRALVLGVATGGFLAAWGVALFVARRRLSSPAELPADPFEPRGN